MQHFILYALAFVGTCTLLGLIGAVLEEQITHREQRRLQAEIDRLLEEREWNGYDDQPAGQGPAR